jgi:hypothetical protein
VMYVAFPVLVTVTSTDNSYEYITSALFSHKAHPRTQD